MKPMRKCVTIAELIDYALPRAAAAAEKARQARLLAIEAAEERERLLFGPPRAFAPGDEVVLTATACRNWASVMGYPVTRALTSVWTVLACGCALCARGSHVCTDERLSDALSYPSNDNDGTRALRHISVMQLKRKGEMSADDGLSTGPDQPRISTSRRGGRPRSPQ